MSQNIFDDDTFFKGYKALRETDNNFNVLLEQPAMAELLPDLKGKIVLDLGCGYGHNCKEFISLGAESVVGIDISEKMLSVATSENADRNISYIRMDMNEIDIISQKFDYIYSSLAFHYIKDFDSFIGKIYSLLNENGVLLYSQEHPIITATIDGKGYWVKNDSGEKIAYTFSNYNQSGERKTFWYIDGVIKYHRPIGEIVTTLARHGFFISKLIEPTPKQFAIDKLPTIVKEFLKPNFLIIEAKKLNLGK